MNSAVNSRSLLSCPDAFTARLTATLLLIFLCTLVRANIHLTLPDEILTALATDTVTHETIFEHDPGTASHFDLMPDHYAEEYITEPEPFDSRNWWELFKRNQLNLNDSTVEWPKFMRFCLGVYNWADKAFNSYDTTYVVGTGRRWKARLTSENWADSYAMHIGKDMPIRMMGDIYSSLGAYLQYMAISVGYSIDMTHLLTNKPIDHKKFEFGFNCARFNIDLYYNENTGGTFMRKFGRYNDGKLFKLSFPGLSLYKFGVNAYYFGNNRRYAQGAAYNFSKFQKRSAGSWIIGVAYSDLNVNLELRKLAARLIPYLNVLAADYRFHYNSYCLMGGYAYNWVLNPHLLLNFTAMPTIGLSHCYEDSLEGTGMMTAMSGRAMSSLTYNIGDFFVCLIAKFDGNWYKSHHYSFFSSIETLQANVGIRF